MGILDDAIKEHLELKRSHGASEDEIRRKEAEAFGAPRADAAAEALPEPPQDEHTELLTPDEPAAVAAEHEPVDHEPAPDPDADADVPPAAEAGAGMLEPSAIDTGPPIAPSHHRDEQHPALADHDHIGGEEHAPDPVFRQRAEAPTAPPDAPLEPAPVDDPPVGAPPVENPDVDEPPPRQSPERAEGEAGEDEDVLEETPEFLQDAPEHDRLWFEQKPPRDFDFGE